MNDHGGGAPQPDEFDYTALGRYLCAARKAKRLTQRTLAAQLGLSTSYLGHVERGTRKPSLWTLHLLGEALDLSAAHLLGLPDPQPPAIDVRTMVRRLLQATRAEAEAILAESQGQKSELRKL